MPSQLSDCTREHLKFKIFWGEDPQKPVFEVHRILHTKFTLPPLKTKNIHFAEFSKKKH